MKSRSGFTIVELLIVIVVIGILAAITIVVYDGIQQRGRDSQRRADFAALEKALRIYRLDNNGFPRCAASGAFIAGVDAATTCSLSTISAQLVPKYLSTLPQDPVNSGSSLYRYAVGFAKASGSCTLTYAPTQDAYLLGTKLESTTSGACAGYWGVNDINLIAAGTGG